MKGKDESNLSKCYYSQKELAFRPDLHLFTDSISRSSHVGSSFHSIVISLSI
jgi:hypothetical protein